MWRKREEKKGGRRRRWWLAGGNAAVLRRSWRRRPRLKDRCFSRLRGCEAAACSKLVNVVLKGERSLLTDGQMTCGWVCRSSRVVQHLRKELYSRHMEYIVKAGFYGLCPMQLYILLPPPLKQAKKAPYHHFPTSSSNVTSSSLYYYIYRIYALCFGGEEDAFDQSIFWPQISRQFRFSLLAF